MSFKPVKNLLSVSADAKTTKGTKLGVLTGILYLAPYNISGYQVCPKATDGCAAACLYTAGRGAVNSVQISRINKTKWFFEDRKSFMDTLVKNVESLVRKAKRENLIPAVRLNGTSDIPWEKMRVDRDGVNYGSIMEAFSDVQFYDYTKIAGRKKALQLENYHLTFSLAENNDKTALEALRQGYNLAVVLRVKRNESKPSTWSGYPVVDGDESDVRFFDPASGHIVALTAKGAAVRDTSGFVREVDGVLNPNVGRHNNLKIKTLVA